MLKSNYVKTFKMLKNFNKYCRIIKRMLINVEKYYKEIRNI